MKKGQISGELLRKLIVVVFIIIILIAGLLGLQKIEEKRDQVETVMIRSDVEEVIEGNIDVGVSTIEEVGLPENKDLCFADLSKRGKILNSSQINRFPIIKDILESGVEENIFILRDDEIIDSSYGRVCLDDYPYFVCTEFSTKPLDVLLEGRGRCTSIFFEDAVVSGKNKKDLGKYAEKMVFFIPYEKGNWKKIIRLVPIAMWNEEGSLKSHPYIVYSAAPSSELDNAKVKSILDDKGSTNATVFESPYVVEEQNGYTINKATLTDEYYFSFWKEYSDIVLVDLNNKDSALISALYAAELNAPLIFVNSNNIKDYKEYIREKIIHVIDTIDEMEELNVTSEKISLSGSKLRSQVVSDRFNMLKSKIDTD
ncbi:hypothetical protein KY361_03560 [Candidatus Woesearchaeota archaeon]|nr:hypothetical protein [Candidatus Woesearchaeota archaeon]